MSIGEKLFWNLYAELYDTLTKTIPYLELHKDIAYQASQVGRDDARVLDAGCGTGHQLQLLRRRHPSWKLTGIDRSEEMLHVAEKKLRGKNVVLAQVDMSQDLPFSDETFDVVISTNVLYTLSAADHLRELRRVLRKNGTLVLVNPWNPKPLQIFIDHYGRVGKRKRLGEVLDTARDTPAYIAILALNLLIAMKAKGQTYTFTSSEDIKELLPKTGFALRMLRADSYSNTCVLSRAEAV